ncbi:MAG TPA: hypothetical protein VJR50_20825, partial [Mycobacterium sp.]|nr:hypothetical protein [Mycobacterium sp.]
GPQRDHAVQRIGRERHLAGKTDVVDGEHTDVDAVVFQDRLGMVFADLLEAQADAVRVLQDLAYLDCSGGCRRDPLGPADRCRCMYLTHLLKVVSGEACVFSPRMCLRLPRRSASRTKRHNWAA